ncbi:bacteriophage N4 adsorption protein B [Polystyrenella longa]|uniref:Bacteriophage N4 adsorption protein B n=1 Tax=Polystyrenella longa TaxID=2528007 RepID=A0A518CMF5_9PLAN|nr:general secretion pathway protein GspE [Polystyrenella longa]QDU80405.1 bacteriophage N4 adsorption protein B [Polystyrenella longa]
MALDVYKDWLGIPEGDRPPDHYQLLRLLQFEDDPAKIEAHYKKLNAHVRKYATGKFQQESQDLLNELARAMLCLTDPERKQEYDESLGRHFDADVVEEGRKSMGGWLVANGHLSKAQVKEAETFAEARGLDLRDAFVQMRLVEPELATRAYAEEKGRSYVDLNLTLPDDSVLDKTPRRTVKKYSVIPLFIEDDRVLVASVYEPTHELEDEFRLRYGVPMHVVMAPPLQIQQAISKYYAPGMREGASDDDVETTASGKSKSKPKKAKAAKASSGPVVHFSQLEPEEQKKRRQIGAIAINLSFILGYVLDKFVLEPYLLPDALIFGWIPTLGTWGLLGGVLVWLFGSYWK